MPFDGCWPPAGEPLPERPARAVPKPAAAAPRYWWAVYLCVAIELVVLAGLLTGAGE